LPTRHRWTPVDAAKAIPGRVRSRINVSNKGFKHVVDKHFNPAKARGKSQFTISREELLGILTARNTVRSTVDVLGDSGNFRRVVALERDVGITAGNLAVRRQKS
jgi:hypothetical protein